MKIAAILEDNISAGGGFNQALNTILQMQALCAGRFGFEVLTTRVENVKLLEAFGLKVGNLSFTVADKCAAYFAQSSAWVLAQNRLNALAPLEKKLLGRDIDLVYFLTQSIIAGALVRLNFITTVYDLCHRDMHEFPEVGRAGFFRLRERHFQTNLPRATIAITDSEQLSDAITRRYGIDASRLLAMPFAPSPFLATGDTSDKATVLGTYQLEEGYFFYPAQFWPHKNHIRILEALLILKGKGLDLRAVFVGGDKGNQSHVQAFANRHGLAGQVRFLGFIPPQHLRGLYEACTALVMPTYFGPTNLPPLEAWSLAKPVIYSAHLRAQTGDAALYADPDNAMELAEAMQASTDPTLRNRLVAAGNLRLAEIAEQRKAAEAELLKHLERFAAKRRCWA